MRADTDMVTASRLRAKENIRDGDSIQQLTLFSNETPHDSGFEGRRVFLV